MNQASSNRRAGRRLAASGRLLVDLTGPMRRTHGSAIRAEAAIARVLLARDDLRALPVAFDETGAICALDADAVAAILSPPTPPTRWRAAAQQPAPQPTPEPTPPRSRLAPLRMATAAARAVARNAIRMLPEPIREDSRAVLIHGRAIVRTVLRGRTPPEPRPAAALGATGEQAPPAASPPRLTRLRAIVHPRAGDLLWTVGAQGGTAPLRRLREDDRYSGLRVAALAPAVPSRVPVAGALADLPATALEATTLDLLAVASLLVVLSASDRDGLLAFAADHALPAPEVAAVPSGSTLVDLSEAHARVPDPAGLTGPRRFALFEAPPRGCAGLERLVRSWEVAAQQPGFDLDLVVTGGEEPGSHAAAALEATSLLGERIHWIDRCPDELLAALYRSAEAVLVPNDPVLAAFALAEARAFGCPVATLPGADAAALLVADAEAWLEGLRRIATAPRGDAGLVDAESWGGSAATIAPLLAALLSAPADG